ncbi:MAG: GH116 family glycosyl-hydrolase [Nakamurella sp.]
MNTPRPRRRHDSAAAPHVSMPLGGIGTGNLSISSDGSFRQWQLHNIGNHAGALPNSFLSVRVSRIEPPLDVTRVLQARPTGPEPTPLVTDADVPQWMHTIFDVAEPMAQSSFSAIYPAATVELTDPAVPLKITVEALNPLVPSDTAVSSLPVVMLTITLVNADDLPLHGTLGAAQQNPVGWDGVSPIDGVFGAGYGGNDNRTDRRDGWTSLVMDNVVLPDGDPGQGQFVVAVDSADAAVLPQWRTAQEWFAFLGSRALASGAGRLSLDRTPADSQRHAGRSALGPSGPGATWNGGIGAPFHLEPGQTTTVRVLLAWTFPHRYVNFEQFGPERPEWGSSRFWLGNHHTGVHPDARSVRDDVVGRWDTLWDSTHRWVDTFAESSLEAAPPNTWQPSCR